MDTTDADTCRSIRHALERYSGVRAAYLFGSRAAGRAGPESDVDLALLGPRDELQARKLDILSSLVEEGLERVDLVLLDGADPALRFEAVHCNRLVYATDGFDHGDYFSRSLREYFDLEPFLAIQREALKRRMLLGQA